MITCDGCRTTLQLESLEMGLAQARDGQLLCPACLPPDELPADDAVRCDACGASFPTDHLRRQTAGIVDGHLCCTRCRVKLERGRAELLDLRLVGSGLLLFVILPLSAALLLIGFRRPAIATPAPTATPVDAAEREATREALAGLRARLAERDLHLQTLRAQLAQRAAATVERGAARVEGEALGRLLTEIGTQYHARFARDLSASDARTRIMALLRIAEVGDPGLAEPVRERLDDDIPRVRAFAAMTLGRLGDRGAVFALVKSLDDRDRTVRAAAARALERITGRPAASFDRTAAGRDGDAPRD